MNRLHFYLLTATIFLGLASGINAWQTPVLENQCGNFSITLPEEENEVVDFSWHSDFSDLWTVDFLTSGTHALTVVSPETTLYARYNSDTEVSTSSDVQVCEAPPEPPSVPPSPPEVPPSVPPTEPPPTPPVAPPSGGGCYGNCNGYVPPQPVPTPTPEPTCVPIANFDVTNKEKGDHQLELMWSGGSGSIQLDWWKDGGTKNTTLISNDHYFEAKGLDNNTYYWFQLKNDCSQTIAIDPLP